MRLKVFHELLLFDLLYVHIPCLFLHSFSSASLFQKVLTQFTLGFDYDGLALECELVPISVASHDLKALRLCICSLFLCEPLDDLGTDQKMHLLTWLVASKSVEGGGRFGGAWSLIRTR